MQSFNPSSARSSRRGFVAGSAAVGAAAVAVTTLPGVGQPPAAAVSPLPLPERGGGYRVSEHVKRYYQTTLI